MELAGNVYAAWEIISLVLNSQVPAIKIENNLLNERFRSMSSNPNILESDICGLLYQLETIMSRVTLYFAKAEDKWTLMC